MAQEYVKISELEPTTSFGTADQFVIVQDEETVKIDGASLAESLATLTNLATRSYVDAVVDSAPGTLDTLRELAAALNDDENFASNIVGLINEKLPAGNFGLEFWNQLATVNTYHIQEGSNLYWTQERFDAALASKNTYHLVEGSNLYFTEQRVLDVVTPLIPNSIFDLGVPDVGTPENIPGYLYYNGNSLSWQPGGGYSLPTASTSVLGGVKVDGNTIVIDSYGTITAVAGGVMSPDPVFNSVTTTQLNVQNITFTGTGAVNIFSGNDLNLSAVGNVTVNGQNFVAFSGNYNDLIDKPTNPTYNSVIVSGPITNPSHATTKAYVDWKVSSIPTPSWNSIANISNQFGPTRIALGRNAGGVTDADGYGGYGAYGGGSSPYAVAIGNSSGKTNQGGAAVAIGVATGYTDQGENAVAVGFTAGNVYQGTAAVAVGPSAGNVYQGVNAVAVGNLAGYSSQGTNAIAIGFNAGKTNQIEDGIAIGHEAGYTGQSNSIAIGRMAGYTGQNGGSVAIGTEAGVTDQGGTSIAIGFEVGKNSQGEGTIAIGAFAGYEGQGNGSISIGRTAGQTNQGINSIAIGNGAGTFNQPNNTIIINATGDHIGGSGSFVNGVPNQTNSLYIAPIRSADATDYVAYYNPETKEVTYGPAPSGDGGGAMSPDPVFNSVTATDLNVQNVTFSGTGPVTINSNNDLNFTATGDVTFNGEFVVTKTQLKSIVAASVDFADFKARIAAL